MSALPSSSLRGATRRSNPDCRRGSNSGLLRYARYARNDGGESCVLSHHARRESRLPPRRLDLLFQETARFASRVARAGIGEGAAFVVGGADGLAGFFAFAVLHLEIAQIAA